MVNTADTVTEGILAAVGDCEQSKYFILQQPGLTVADLQSDFASTLRTWASGSPFQQHVKIDNVISDINADELAGKIASRCGATNDEGWFKRPGVGAGKMFTGEGKEVGLAKADSGPTEKTIGQLCKSQWGDVCWPRTRD